jgi:hypothetical protein
VQCIERIFGASSQPVDNKEVRRLRGQIEHLLGKREDWEMPLLRALFDILLQRARRRRRSPEHERLWLNLAGFCLRPGLGYALDEWRIEQLCDLFPQGIQYVNESQNWSEWWTLWRRAAGGLPAAVQEQLLAELGPWLRAEPTKSRSRLAATIAGSHDDMLRLSPRSKDYLSNASSKSANGCSNACARTRRKHSAGGRSAASAPASRSMAAPTR